CNIKKISSEEKKKLLGQARKRSEKVPGGFCGFYGNCGAAVGTGIFVSLMTQATPLTTKSWQQSNLMTAKSLLVIAENGGPRCCKRDTYLAITEAVQFLSDEFDLQLPITKKISCQYHEKNQECLNQDCPFFS
ncbi:MAG: DUF5714 domain-containing protein, partial [Spirochaetes bacterium]|nr:DUF5714 domain-containing protein [Spirochaetota bacterium]